MHLALLWWKLHGEDRGRFGGGVRIESDSESIDSAFLGDGGN